MLSKEISHIILTISREYEPPRGGIAQVMYTYLKKVYPVFRCITNFGNGGFVKKLWQFVWGWLKTFFEFLFKREIKIVNIHIASYNNSKQFTYFICFTRGFLLVNIWSRIAFHQALEVENSVHIIGLKDR